MKRVVVASCKREFFRIFMFPLIRLKVDISLFKSQSYKYGGEQNPMVEEAKGIYVRSFGCPTNLADGERIAGCLYNAGFKIVEGVDNANILIYNTCAVKTPTENRIMEILKRAPRNKRILITGCLPLINLDRLKAEVRFDGVLGPAPSFEIVDVVRRVDRGEKVIMLETNSKPTLDLPKIPKNKVIGIIPISYGCQGSCSYCCVVFARGSLRSYSINDLVRRLEHDLALGTREIWLTSQDTACYGRDISTNLADLLTKICKVKGKFFVRVGMMTPNHALELLDELVEAYKHKKVFKFLHIPVQSGDDEVLKLMNRFYSVADFKTIVSSFRGEIPNMTIATDVICGFPGESLEAFERTTELVKNIQPDIVNVSKFAPRPHTPAAKMNRLPNQEVKRRSKKMSEFVRETSFKRNKAWVGWKGESLIDERGKGDTWIGRNFSYKPIVIRGDKSLLGRFMNIRVVEAHQTYLEAQINS